MTDSQVASIPDGWDVRRLKFVVSCNDESLPETSDPALEIEYVDISSVELEVGIKNFDRMSFDEAPSRARRIVRSGDTIVSTVRTYLKAIAAIKCPPENLVVSTGFAVLRPRELVNCRYLAYALQASSFVDSVVAHSTGVSYPAINPSELVCLAIAFPRDKAIQEQIADFLDWKTSQLDALIAKKREAIEKLKERRLAVITQAVTKGLDPQVKLRDSEIPWLGSIPAHWEVKRLKFIGKAIIGLTYDPSDLVDESNGVQVLRANNIQGGVLVQADSVYVSCEVSDELRLRIGDILVCSRNGSRALIGKCGRVTPEFVGATFGAFNTVFRGENSDFVYYVFNSLLFDYQSGSFLTSTINQLTIGNFNSMVLPCPPGPECRAIAEYLDAMVDRFQSMIDKANDVLERLIEYRSALITAAVTGKLDVRLGSFPVTA